MNTVTVDKEELLNVLNGNQKSHRETYEHAHEAWKSQVRSALMEAKNKAQAGTEYRTYFNLPEPKSYDKEYDRAIRMVEMEVSDTIQLTQQEFTRYVMDEWEWTSQFTSTASAYLGS